MEKTARVQVLVEGAIDELNAQRAAGERLAKEPQAPLFGDEGRLDSLGLVQLIAEVENRVEEEFGRTINLADEELLQREDNPFRTLGALVQYIAGRLRE